MALQFDPNVLEAIRGIPGKVLTPQDVQTNALKLQEAAQGVQAGQLNIQNAQMAQQEAQRKQQVQQQILQAVAKGHDPTTGEANWHKIAADVIGIDPIAGEAMGKYADAQDTAKETLATAGRKEIMARLATVRDAPLEQQDALYEPTVAAAVADKIPGAERLPKTMPTDPNARQAFLNNYAGPSPLVTFKEGEVGGRFINGQWVPAVTIPPKTPVGEEIPKIINNPVTGAIESYWDPVTKKPYQKVDITEGTAPPHVIRTWNSIEAQQQVKPTAAPATIRTAQGIMQWNPASKKFDIKAGELAPTGNQGLGATTTDPKDIAQAIIEGKQPPILTGLYRDAAPVRAELARKGYDLATALGDWTATQKNLASMNSTQQLKLRQAITFTNETLPQIQDAYAEWKKQAGIAGFKILNKANLAAMKQLPGAAGSAATQLDGLIGDFTSELGTVYKGGNSSTDESLKLAAQNLSSDWNDKTFNDAIARIGRSLRIRTNSIQQAPVGVSAGSPYSGGATVGASPVTGPTISNPYRK